MLEFIVSNIGTIVVLIALTIIVGVIVFKMYRDKKQGKSSCGCNCANCPMSGKCHK